MPGPLHIVSFDNPFPPVYGGVIDVFYKVRALHQLGFRIYLHCFVDEVPEHTPEELSAVTTQVFFYRKRRNRLDFLAFKPYSVQLRRHPDLAKNLLATPAPMLFEGLKTIAVVPEILGHQQMTLRLQNIEQDYFFGVAKSEDRIFHRIAFWLEGWKFRRFEPMLTWFDSIVTLSLHETAHLSKLGFKATYIPLFHGNEKVRELSGSGKFAVYAGDFNSADNRRAATFIAEVFRETGLPLVIASSGEEDFLKSLSGNHMNIRIVQTKTYPELEQLLAEAHINVMFSFQRSGSKLKVINGLFNSRHCLINSNMIDDSRLLELCHLAEDRQAFAAQVKRLWTLPYDDYEKRRQILETVMSDTENARKLAEYINE